MLENTIFMDFFRIIIGVVQPFYLTVDESRVSEFSRYSLAFCFALSSAESPFIVSQRYEWLEDI